MYVDSDEARNPSLHIAANVRYHSKQLCAKSNKGRVIKRTEYTPYMEENQRKTEQNKVL